MRGWGLIEIEIEMETVEGESGRRAGREGGKEGRREGGKEGRGR